MKSHKKLIIAFAVLIALGIVATAIAQSYDVFLPITSVSITSHSNGDIVFAGKSYNMTCTTSTDMDVKILYECEEILYLQDNVVHTWTGDGTFNPNVGTDVAWWSAPKAEGCATVRVTADDAGAPVYADDASVYDEITLTVQNHIYVDCDATGNDDGTTWANAFDSLQEALDATAKGNEIWVAEGTYKPTSRRYSGEPQSVSFKLKDEVKVYGGFDGTETSLSERDPSTHITILSGDIDNDNTLDADNAWHVVSADTDNVTPEGRIDGCTITKGYADGGSPEDNGGAMYNQQESPWVENCKITDNYASNVGGGIYSNISSSQTIIGCTFTSNSADAGGGMYVKDSLYHVVKNCMFKENDATVTHGGGLYVEAKDRQRIANCAFVDNDADDYGGGLFIKYQTPDPKITSCSFILNTAAKGGAIGADQMSSTGHGDLNITNCILWNNKGTTSAGEVYEYGADDSYTYLNYSDIDGGFNGYKLYSEQGAYNDLKGDTGNIDDDPEMTYSGWDLSENTNADGGTNYFVVDDGSDYSAGDIIEYDKDTTARVVVGVSGNTVYISPQLVSNSLSGKNIYQWDDVVSPSIDIVTNWSGSLSYILIADPSKYQVDDIIEIRNDDVGRKVTSINTPAKRVYFTPNLPSATHQGDNVKNYGHGWKLDFDSDCVINSGSLCIDAGDNTKVHRHDVTDYTGTNARKIDDPTTTDTGNLNGESKCVDIGADEYGTATPPEPETITIVAICFIDESQDQGYENNSNQYDKDLQAYRSLMYSSGIADIFKAGCLVPDDPISGVLPTGYEAPDDVSIENITLPLSEGELYNGASDHWDRIRDGVTPDYVILSKDISGSMAEHDLDEGSYGVDDFKSWLESTYGCTVEIRTFESEFWLAEMATALNEASEAWGLE